VDPAAPQAASKAALQPLPSKVRLQIGLASAINTETAAAGDAITGVLLQDAREKKLGVVAHANDRVHGRILRLEQIMSPVPRWIVGIRFDTIERGGTEQPLFLKSANNGGIFMFQERGNIVLDQRFHSDWETR
jgi:hypothetical protein